MAKDCLHLEFDSISNRCSNCNRLDLEILVDQAQVMESKMINSIYLQGQTTNK
jgi:hypothetical protein